MDFIGKALAPDGTAADETEGAEETELGGDFWDDFLSASPLPPPLPTPLLGVCANPASSGCPCPDAVRRQDLFVPKDLVSSDLRSELRPPGARREGGAVLRRVSEQPLGVLDVHHRGGHLRRAVHNRKVQV